LDTYLYPILIDGENNAKKMEENYAKVYPIFYDETKEVSTMLKQEIKVKKAGRMPALLIVDKEGIIQYAYYGDSMKDIPENDVLFEILEKINK
jgi:peroxiredoxin Q/BCP